MGQDNSSKTSQWNAVTNFTPYNFICRLCIPKLYYLITTTLLTNKHVRELLNDYDIYHVKLCHYYLKGMVRQKLPKQPCILFPIQWSLRILKDRVILSLLSYGTSYHEVHFNSSHVIICGLWWAEAMVIEVMFLSTLLAVASKLSSPFNQLYYMDVLRKSRHDIESKWLCFQK